ncbi:hypothetical protein [Luteibacter sp. 621]|uniref:hypothetical protein n=1 Tax=Luteibacter sp. 621 TaxID=3373916 RepID=UPI003D1FECE7
MSLVVGSAIAGEVTVDTLNQSPERFDGRRVEVDGWVVIGDEARYLVSSKSAIRDIRSATCLSVINGAGLDAREKELNGKHVVLTGTFRSNVFKDQVIRLGLCGKTALDLQDKDVAGNVRVLP